MPWHTHHDSIGHNGHDNDMNELKAVQVDLYEDTQQNVVDVPDESTMQAVVHEPSVRKLQQEDQEDATLVPWAPNYLTERINDGLVELLRQFVALIDKLGEESCHVVCFYFWQLDINVSFIARLDRFC